jgi:hypothetical protein
VLPVQTYYYNYLYFYTGLGSTVPRIGFANPANAITSRFRNVQTVQLTDNELSSDSAHDLMVWNIWMLLEVASSCTALALT